MEENGMAKKDGIRPHYWVIGPPEGPTSIGICRLCGAKKEFENSYKAAIGNVPNTANEIVFGKKKITIAAQA
jgi:hypothetical protein